MERGEEKKKVKGEGERRRGSSKERGKKVLIGRLGRIE